MVNANPRFLWAHNAFDELYLLFDAIVQGAHLIAYNASFAEKFYGLLRSDTNANTLSNRQRMVSLYLLTVWPYTKRKLDTMYADMKRAAAEQSANSNHHSKSVKYFLNTYPIVCAVYECVHLIYQVRYAVNVGRHHSPLIALAGCELKTYTKSDTNHNLTTIGAAARLLAKSLGLGLSVGAFLLQFLEFYYARDESLARVARGPIPRPPFAVSAPLTSRVLYVCVCKSCLIDCGFAAD